MLKNIGSTWFLNLLQIAVMLVLSPFVLHRVGADQNGLWVTIVSFTGILGLLILGVPMASVRFIAERVAKKDIKGINTSIASCLGITTVLGIGALLVGAAMWMVFSANYLTTESAMALGPAVVRDAQIAFAVVVVQIAFAFSMRLPYGIFDAHNDFVARNVVMAGELVLRLSLSLALLWWHASLVTMACVQVACMVSEFVVAVTVVKRRHPGIQFGYMGFDRAVVRKILNFSIYAMLLNLGMLLAFRADALVIGAYMSPKDVIWFDFGNKFFDPLSGLVVAVGAVVMPMATRMKADGNLADMREVFLKWSKICLSIVLAVGIYLMVAGPAFLGWWVGPEFIGPSGRVLQVLLPSFLVYLPVRGVAVPMLMGLGSPRVPALGMVAMGVTNVAMSVALVDQFGIVGVAVGTAVPNVIFGIFFLYLACKAIGLTLRDYVSYVVVRAAVGAVVPLLTLWFFQVAFPLAGLLQLAVGGVVMMLMFVATWVLFVYRGDPYIDLHAALRRFVTKRSAGGRP